MKMNKLVRKRIFAAALSAAMVTTAMPEAAIAETSSESGNSTTYTDEAYIDVLSKVVTVDSVAVEAETDINKYGLGTVSANLSSSSGDEVTNTSITWSSSNTNVIKFFDSDNNAFVDTLTTENADSVQFYGVGSGTATITATSGDGPEATTETITVEKASAEWNATVAGVLVNTDTQSGKVGAMNGMVIDTMTNNKVNSKTGKCGMKKGAAKGMQIRNTILSVPVSEDAKIKVKLFQAPSTVVTSNDGSYNWEGLVADGTKVTWDAEECAYTVGFDYDTMAVAGSDMQVSTSDITTGDGSVTSFADSYAQLTFGSSDVYVTSITVETGDGISYSYTAADSYDADIAFAETDDVTLDLNGTTTVSRAASVTGDDAASVTAVYSSSNSDIAEVDSEGNVTAKAIGYTTITAKIPADTDSSSFKTATYDVYVKDTSDVADSYNVKLNTVVTPQTNGTYDFGIVKGTGCYWNDSTHGWCFYEGSTLTFHVNGASTITVGGCQYGAAGKMTLSDGTTSLEGDYSKDCSGSTSFDWTTDESADLTLTFNGSKAYVPYIIVKSADEAASTEIATKWTAAEFAEQAVTAYEGNCGDFNGLYIDATNGKFAKNSSDWIQINAGTVLYVPITADGTLKIETYSAGSTYTAGASATKMTEASEGKVYTYDVDYDTDAVSVDGYDVKFVKVTAGSNDYISTISMDYGTEDSQSENEKSTEESTEEATEEATEESTEEATEESTEEASTEASEESTEEASTEASEETEAETTTDSWTLKGNSAVEGLNGVISEDITLAGDSGNLNLTLSAEGTGVGTSVKNATKFVNHSSGLKIKNDALMISGVTGNVELTINYKNTGGSERNLEVTVGADGTTVETAVEGKAEGTYTTTIDADDTNIYIGASNEIAIASITIAEAEEEEEVTLTTQSVASAVKSAVSSVLGFFGLSGSDEEDTSLETASVDGVTDAYIALDFDSAPEVTESSTLAAHIYNASTGEEVDTVYSNEGEEAADATYYTGSSSTAGAVGKIAVKDNLIAVEDNTLVITPHNDENGYPVLENGTEYYVTLDEGLVSGTLKGTTISSIDDKSTFTFKTSDTTEITDGTIDVNHDGSGDFYTINGALNYLRKAEATGSWAINVAEGNYHERLFYYGDADITLDGADADLGAKVQVDWKNADDYGSGGARSRSTLLVQGTGDMVIR
nr:Ig-like domain-containing protein [Lachnospiraceae bacterium]